MKHSPSVGTVSARLAAALALAITTLGPAVGGHAATPATSSPEAEVLATSVDARGDVRRDSSRFLTTRQKKSIDIQQVTLARVGNKARITITMREVIRSPRFDQIFFVTLREAADTSGGPWTANAGFTTKGRLSYSDYADADWQTYETCGLTVEVKPRKRQVIATLPRRCTPRAPANVTVKALTGHFRSDAGTSSSDRHWIRGWHDFTPDN